MRLDPQIAQHADIELLIRTFEPCMDLGENRQQLLNQAKGQYVCFVDDDDLVAEDYVASIYPLLDGADYIGFRLQFYSDGVPDKPTVHSLRCDGWGNGAFYTRDISHLNPIRRELALMVPMSGGFGEDARWANALRELGVVKTENYIDRVMYHYYWRSKK